MKSSDINIMDKLSTGSQITKKNIEDIFVVSRLKDITKIEIPKEETQVEEIKEEKKETPKKESREQLTMSDFFEEFKI